MFFLRLLQIITGYINFRTDGGSPEKFINLAVRAGVRLWNLTRDGDALCGSAYSGSLNRMQLPAQKAGVRLTVTSKKGLPAVFGRHRGRWGFIAGIFVFIAVFAYFSGFIWTVEITGNSGVSPVEIQYALSGLGLYPGVPKNALDIKSIEQEALLKLPDLSFMHVNLDGSVARVEVGERTARPEVVPDDRPCNITASQTGQIITAQVSEGQQVLNPLDAVQKGELIVSGVIEEPATHVTRYVHARAKIMAATKRELSVTVPYKTVRQTDTGKKINRYTLNILNLSLPLYFTEPKGNYRRLFYKSPLTVGNVRLPVSVTTAAFLEYKNSPAVLTKQQALKEAKALIAQKEKTELSGAQIKNRSYSENAADNSMTLKGLYDCVEDIAVTQEVKFGQKGPLLN